MTDYYNSSSHELTDETRAACLESISRISDWITNSPEGFSETELINLRIAVIAYNGWQNHAWTSLETYLNPDEFSYYPGLAARDEANAKIIDVYKTELFPDKKIVLWAHNWHLQFGRLRYSDDEDPIIETLYNTGKRLKENYGEDYKVVGLIGYNVHINWVSDWPDPEPPTDPNSIEHILYTDFSYPYAIVDLSKTDFLDESQTYSIVSEWTAVPQFPADSYDGIFYLQDAWARQFP